MKNSWQELLLNKSYAQISSFYKELINLEPNLKINYLYLGLSLLLQNKEEESKIIWDLGLQKSNSSDSYNQELVNILEKESLRQQALREYQIAWNICQIIKEIEPEKYDNLARICILSLYLKTFNLDLLSELGFIKATNSSLELGDDVLLEFLVIYADSHVATDPLLLEGCLEIIYACIPYFQNKRSCLQVLQSFALKYSIDIGHKLVSAFLESYPNDRQATLPLLKELYTQNREYDKAIETAREIVLNCPQNILQKANCTYGLLHTLMERGGDWQELESTFKELRFLHSQIVEQHIEFAPNPDLCMPLSVTPFFAPYFEDVPKVNHALQNQILHLFASTVKSVFSDITQAFQAQHAVRKQSKKTQKIKIGYLTTSLRQHSVGWLARSLFQHFDHQSFEIYGYFPAYKQGRDFLEEWYVTRMDFVFRQGVEYFINSSILLAEQINRNEIDILIDLESLTSSVNLSVLALKPAPIQVSWLGWNATRLPTVDYYIADPYVLPEDAQEYYSEKIWRLPHTYIATDGFECATITLCRKDLGIPADAIT